MVHQQALTPDGKIVGTVEEDWTCWIKHWTVKNERGEETFKIEGPCWDIQCCSELEFPVSAEANVHSKQIRTDVFI